MSSYLLSQRVPVPHPFAQARPPVLQQVGLGKLLALTVAESALRARGRQEVHSLQVNLQPLAAVSRDLLLGTPGAAVALAA